MKEITDIKATKKGFISEDIIQSQYDYIEKIREYVQLHSLKRNKPYKYLIRTFGCQMNENDSEKMSGVLADCGMIETEDQFDADVIIFNTCCVRENAEKKVYGHLGELTHVKKQNPNVIIGVCGCMTQQKEVHDFVKNTFKHVNLIFGNSNQYLLPELIYNYLTKGEEFDDISSDDIRISEGMPVKHRYPFKAFVTVMYGCNNFCSYCIVPYVRGRERSRKPEDIYTEIKQLIKNGCKEITLLGQNVNSYGKDLENPISFAELLREVSKIQELHRIRFLTSHPKDLSDELIDVMADCDNVCNLLHLPLQSGSTRLLADMNRKYDKEKYLDLIYKVKERAPDVMLSTDIIVGYPGETEEDFLDTLDVVRKAEYDMAFTFIYSKRTGTPAAKREDQVPSSVANERFSRLIELQNEILAKKMPDFLNTVQLVLVEGESREEGIYTGRTDTNKVVNFIGNDDLIGKFVNVKIDRVTNWALYGSIVEEVEI